MRKWVYLLRLNYSSRMKCKIIMKIIMIFCIHVVSGTEKDVGTTFHPIKCPVKPRAISSYKINIFYVIKYILVLSLSKLLHFPLVFLQIFWISENKGLEENREWHRLDSCGYIFVIPAFAFGPLISASKRKKCNFTYKRKCFLLFLSINNEALERMPINIFLLLSIMWWEG